MMIFRLKFTKNALGVKLRPDLLESALPDLLTATARPIRGQKRGFGIRKGWRSRIKKVRQGK